jgi:hypothetical protein
MSREYTHSNRKYWDVLKAFRRYGICMQSNQKIWDMYAKQSEDMGYVFKVFRKYQDVIKAFKMRVNRFQSNNKSSKNNQGSIYSIRNNQKSANGQGIDKSLSTTLDMSYSQNIGTIDR